MLKNLLIVVLAASTGFVMGYVGIRGYDYATPIVQAELQNKLVAAIPPITPEQKISLAPPQEINLAPIVIVSKMRPKNKVTHSNLNANIENKTWSCKDRDLATGGSVRECGYF